MTGNRIRLRQSGSPLRGLAILGAGLVALLVLVSCSGPDTSAADDDSAAEAEPERSGYERSPTPVVGDIEVLDFAADPAGSPDYLKAEPGGLLLVYFGYLSCPDVCPLTMSDISRSFEALGDDAPRLEVAMITVDPERDTGPEVGEYLAHFFDTYKAVHVDAVTLEKLGEAFSATWEIEEHEPGEYYGVEHTAATYVVDENGSLIWEWGFGVESDSITVTLEELLAEVDGRDPA